MCFTVTEITRISFPSWTFGPICIHPDYKRKGYGLRLLNYALEKAREMGLGFLCMEGNIDFYKLAGFQLASNYGIHYHDMPPGEDAPLAGERCSCSLQMGLRPRCRTSCQRYCYGEEWLSSYGSDGYRRKPASRQRTSYTCNAIGGKIDFPSLPQMQVQKKQARLKCRACCFCL